MTASWSERTVPDIFPDAAHPVDPYLVWAKLSDFAGFIAEPGRPVPVLFESAPDSDLGNDDVANLVRRCRDGNILNRVRASAFGTATVALDELPMLAEAVRVGHLVRFQLGLARGELPLRAARPPTASMITPGPADDRLQTIGVVDDGCCLAHEVFRSAAGSRFFAVWDQDAHAQPDDYWMQANDIPYGVELDVHALDQLFAQRPDVGETAERAIYRTIARPEWGRETRRHGAGVLHVLADTGVPLAFVQLPGDTVADTSGGSLGFYVLDGARYIIKRTEHLARLEGRAEWTTTINISLGSIAGPHDGTTITECALDALASDERVRIVLAAGNTAGRRVHGMRTVAQGQPGVFHVLAPPDNPRETYVEVWLPKAHDDGTPLDPADFDVVVTSPDGDESPAAEVDRAYRLANASNGPAQGGIVFCRRVAHGRHGTMVLVALRPTRRSDATDRATARYGVWSIRVGSRTAKPAAIHAWVERNDLIVGRRRPQQAYFVEDPDDRYIDDRCTYSSIANGANVTVVGAYRIADESIMPYSARGPTRAETRPHPEYLGPSDESVALPGVPVPGFFSGWTSRMSGTSVAAPHVTRWLVQGAPAAQRFEIRPPPDPNNLVAAQSPPAIPAIRRS